MTSPRLPQVTSLAHEINDVPHRLAVVFVASDATESSDDPGVEFFAGWAVAIVVVETGDVLAWDGWYALGPDDGPLPLAPLRDVDWGDWDDMPSKMLVNKTRPWLAGPVADWLLPTFSVAREAADLFRTHFDSEDSRESNRSFRDSSVVAYLPLVDEDVMTTEVARLASRSRFGDGGALATLEAALRGLDTRGGEG
ncbi:hypothetical protein OMK64_01915 [Cellulomonas fimi]|uniref:hypothetical protein n=1 Tax=Cellulomonas fimi TaxID=1708 RepID=UPI00234E1351|nr:hypothetical protein [Cellulomonas fimi]MDC7120288.1 hypothetical protein [Cellulomonas fimi]